MYCRWAWYDDLRVLWKCKCYMHSIKTITRFCIWIIFQAKDMQGTIAWRWEIAFGHTIKPWNGWHSTMCCALKLWSAVGITSFTQASKEPLNGVFQVFCLSGQTLAATGYIMYNPLLIPGYWVYPTIWGGAKGLKGRGGYWLMWPDRTFAEVGQCKHRCRSHNLKSLLLEKIQRN